MSELLDLFKKMDFSGEERTDTAYNSKVLFVDAMNTFMRNFSALPTMDDFGDHVGGMVGFLKSIGAAIKDHKPTRVVIVFDGVGGSQRRRALYPDYKSQRKTTIRLNRVYDFYDESEYEKNVKYQLVHLVSILQNLPVTVISIDNIEADDAIAYGSELVTLRGGTSIIYSTDKDFLQLVSETIRVFNPVKRKMFDIEQVLNVYSIHPSNFLMYKALSGDKSDNISGIRGAGDKTILKYLPDLSDGNIDVNFSFIERKYEGQKKVPKLVQNILEGKDTLSRNIKLMDLRNVNISMDAKTRIGSYVDNNYTGYNKSNLIKNMKQAKILNHFPNLDFWLSNTFVPLTRFYESASDDSAGT
jgi:5'-3' exonuclease